MYFKQLYKTKSIHIVKFSLFLKTDVGRLRFVCKTSLKENK